MNINAKLNMQNRLKRVGKRQSQRINVKWVSESEFNFGSDHVPRETVEHGKRLRTEIMRGSRTCRDSGRLEWLIEIPCETRT